MYNVSAEFLTAMKEAVQECRISGTITTGGTSYSFTPDNVLARSFSLSNQCSGNDNVEIGKVYTASLEATFMKMSLPRYNLKNAEIRPYCSIKTGEGYESVPLGIFYIAEANWTTWGVEVVAYDAMTSLDKEITFDTTFGTVYDFLAAACQACNVTLSQTAAQIRALPNGQREFSIYAENDIATWRDLVYWCAVTTATFATVNRAGQLELRSYNMIPVDDLGLENRIKTSRFSDFETKYTSVSITSIETGVESYYALPVNDGLNLELGKNPFIQYGSAQFIEEICRNILTAVSTFAYVPMEVEVAISAPVYDLGDVLVFNGGTADDEKCSCITRYDWTFGQKYKIKGVGQNPELVNAQSKVDKELQGISRTINAQEIIFYEFINSGQIHVLSGESALIANIRYAGNSKTKVEFELEALLNVETDVIGINYYDAVATITYELNELQIAEYKPKETWQDGKHILHLRYVLDLNTTLRQHLAVYLSMSGGSALAEIGHVRATIKGQGLAATDSWDGTIEIRQAIGQVDASNPSAATTRSLTDSVDVRMQTPEKREVIEEISVFIAKTPIRATVSGIEDIVTVSTEVQE